LISLKVTPPDAAPSAGLSSVPDWSALFELAGLDPALYLPIEPIRIPPVFADATAAWTGALTEFGGLPVRIEAAALGGKPVFFELVIPSDPYWEVPAGRHQESPQSRLVGWLWTILSTSVLSVASVLVIRNWRSGRADRRGAFRVAGVVLSLHLGWWILGGHHVASLREEILIFSGAASHSLAAAAFIWCLYVAMEPHVRRRHPRSMVAWTRLLHGRFHDPLVARDLLIGLAIGSALHVVSGQVYTVIPHLLGWDAPPPPLAHPGPQWFGPPVQALLGGRHVAAAFAAIGLSAFYAAFTFMVFLLGLRIVLRSDWIALPLLVVFLTAFSPVASLSGFSWFGLLCSFVCSLVFSWCLAHFGFVATLGACAAGMAYQLLPITTDTGAPHFGTGMVGVLFFVGWAIYAALMAMGARRNPIWTSAPARAGS